MEGGLLVGGGCKAEGNKRGEKNGKTNNIINILFKKLLF